MDLEAVGDELYAVLPADFVAARKEQAQRAKDAGDADLARAVARLPKPTAAAWAVNQLIRHRPAEIEQVLTLGASLREAQESLDAAQMRQLTTQRRQLTAAVTRSARAVAAELGQPISGGVAEQVESTLHAAMVDAGAADAVRAGQLTQPLMATGFGDVDVTTAMASGSRTRPARAARPELSVVPDDTRAREEAQERATRAADELRAAEETAAETRQRVQDLTARSLELAAQLDELRRRLEQVEHELGGVGGELEEAEAEQESQDEAVAEARAEARAARRELDAFDA